MSRSDPRCGPGKNRHGTFSLSDSRRGGSSALRAPPCPILAKAEQEPMPPLPLSTLPTAEIKAIAPQKSLESNQFG